MAEENHNVLEVIPATELKFRGPFTSVVTSHLTLKNNKSKSLCYKVKTTAPRMYCVRPNSGIIEPSKDVEIAVMLQPFDFNSSEKLKHKFLVQSTPMEFKYGDNFEQLWKNVSKDDINEIKLRCAFENEQSAGDTATTPERIVNISNNAHPGLATSVDEMRQQLEELKGENTKLKENEVRLRKIALQDTLDHSTIPAIVEQTKQSNSSQLVLLMILCLVSFIIGLVVAKFSL